MSAHDSALVDRLYSAAVEIGESLPSEARPFFVAYLEPLGALLPDLWARIGRALGVREMTAECCLLMQWGRAVERDDAMTCDAIERQFDAAGVSNNVWAAVRAAGDVGRRLAAERLGNTRGTLH